ncbi:MAG: hypothetical protein WAU65_01130 [Candidatus Nanoarchaeia archaeon]
MLHNNFLIKSKQAQVSETITWVVATIIILVILIVSTFLASLVGKSKVFPPMNHQDLFAEKSFTSYLLTKDISGLPIYYELGQQGNLSSSNGNLASVLFNSLYEGYYSKGIYLGLLDSDKQVIGDKNPYFNGPAAAVVSIESNPAVSTIFYKISLDNNKFVQLILWHQN